MGSLSHTSALEMKRRELLARIQGQDGNTLVATCRNRHGYGFLRQFDVHGDLQYLLCADDIDTMSKIERFYPATR